MNVKESLKYKNPPRGDAYILVCGKSFIETIEKLKTNETIRS